MNNEQEKIDPATGGVLPTPEEQKKINEEFDKISKGLRTYEPKVRKDEKFPPQATQIPADQPKPGQLPADRPVPPTATQLPADRPKAEQLPADQPPPRPKPTPYAETGWKPITDALYATFKTDIAKPHDGHVLSATDQKIVTETFEGTFQEDATTPPPASDWKVITDAGVQAFETCIAQPKDGHTLSAADQAIITGCFDTIFANATGWNAITEASFDAFQTCIAQPKDGHALSTADQAIATDCFEAQFYTGDETEPPVEPPVEPPPTGDFAACGDNQSQRGLLAWSQWCVDESRNYPTLAGGVMGMESNAEAVRSRLPGTRGRGIAPPTAGSNRVVMEFDILFNEDWLRGISLGGQHLGKMGEGPFRILAGGTSADHIRFDIGCFNVTNADGSSGNGFKDGFRVLVYEQKSGAHREIWFPSTTKMPGIFKAGVWTHVKADGRYNPTDGRCILDLTIGGQTRHAEITVSKGIIPKLGDSISWGNVDARDNTVNIKNLVYRPS